MYLSVRYRLSYIRITKKKKNPKNIYIEFAGKEISEVYLCVKEQLFVNLIKTRMFLCIGPENGQTKGNVQ